MTCESGTLLIGIVLHSAHTTDRCCYQWDRSVKCYDCLFEGLLVPFGMKMFLLAIVFVDNVLVLVCIHCKDYTTAN